MTLLLLYNVRFLKILEYIRRTSTEKHSDFRNTNSKCHHNDIGYCRFREKCRKQHFLEVCTTENCDKTCLGRHPKQCKFFSQSGFCKFGDSCSYKHTSSSHLSIQIQALEARIGDLCKAMKVLEDEVRELKNVNQCERCDYKANSSTSLKTHISKKPYRNQRSLS